MSELHGLASYKKKDGTLSLIDAGQLLQWAPSAAGSQAPVLIPIGGITNLQATPPTSAKVMIKVFVSQDGESTVEQYVFTFTSTTAAREEADAMKEGLTSAIQAAKAALIAAAEGPAAGNADGDGKPDAQQGGPAATERDSEIWTKAQLESNMELQQDLLTSSPELQKIFHETVVLGQVTMTQFWSSRTHLLRAYAAERAQVKGPYNVLATIKLKIEDNVSRLSLSRDQIHQIFEQHAVIRRAYDENVPKKLTEDAFWSRLILSRLFKKLKGERVTAQTAHDEIFDQYLRMEEGNETEQDPADVNVPNIIDLEGNEENHSQKRGNQPDLTMRPSKPENVPIIRTLNNLSSKIMERVVPSYKQGGGGDDDVDKRYMEELTFNDLQAESLEERIMLNIHDQQRFFDSNSEKKDAEREAAKAPVTLSDGIGFLHKALGTSNIDLAQVVGDDDAANGADSANGADADGVAAAMRQVVSTVQTRRAQMTTIKSSKKDKSREGLSEDCFANAKLTQSTTNEFLRQFWNAFLSGESKRVNEVSGMVTSLKRSLERIEAVADTAEKEKAALLEKLLAEQEQREREGKKKKRRKIENEVGGGKATVLQMINPRPVDVALKRYEQALQQAGPE